MDFEEEVKEVFKEQPIEHEQPIIKVDAKVKQGPTQLAPINPENAVANRNSSFLVDDTNQSLIIEELLELDELTDYSDYVDERMK